MVLDVAYECRPFQVILRSFNRQEVVQGGSRRGKDVSEVVLVWSPCDSSGKKAIQMVLDVAYESRPFQVILRSFKRQEVVQGGSKRGKDGPEVVLVWSPCDSSGKKPSKWF